MAGFSDELLSVDNRSNDGTWERIEALRARIPGVEVHWVDDPNRSHSLIGKYAGEQVWVMGVDGDEIYDTDGLAPSAPGCWQESSTLAGPGGTLPPRNPFRLPVRPLAGIWDLGLLQRHQAPLGRHRMGARCWRSALRTEGRECSRLPVHLSNSDVRLDHPPPVYRRLFTYSMSPCLMIGLCSRGAQSVSRSVRARRPCRSSFPSFPLSTGALHRAGFPPHLSGFEHPVDHPVELPCGGNPRLRPSVTPCRS